MSASSNRRDPYHPFSGQCVAELCSKYVIKVNNRLKELCVGAEGHRPLARDYLCVEEHRLTTPVFHACATILYIRLVREKEK